MDAAGTLDVYDALETSGADDHDYLRFPVEINQTYSVVVTAINGTTASSSPILTQIIQPVNSVYYNGQLNWLPTTNTWTNYQTSFVANATGKALMVVYLPATSNVSVFYHVNVVRGGIGHTQVTIQ